MKKRIFGVLVLFAVLAVLVGCDNASGGSKSSSVTRDPALVGSWGKDNIVWYKFNSDGTATVTDMNSEGNPSGSYMEFMWSADGKTLTLTQGNTSVSSAYSIKNNTLVIEEDSHGPYTKM